MHTFMTSKLTDVMFCGIMDRVKADLKRLGHAL